MEDIISYHGRLARVSVSSYGESTGGTPVIRLRLLLRFEGWLEGPGPGAGAVGLSGRASGGRKLVRLGRRAGHRFDVDDQVHHLLFGELPVEAGHDRRITGDDFCRRVKDRFAQVVFIGDDGAAAFKV